MTNDIRGQQSTDSVRWYMNWKILGGVGGVLVAFVLYFALVQPIQVLPLIGPAPAFELTNQYGDLFRSFDDTEHYTLYAFSATRDGTGFGDIIRFLQGAEVLLEENGWDDSVRFVVISVDPEHDESSVLQAKFEQLALDDSRYMFLTGPPVAVKLAVGTGFGVYYESPQLEDNFVYDQKLVLVDNAGIIRANYDMNYVNYDILERDFDLLFTEAAAEGVSTVAYSAAHLFLCFPR